VHSRVFSTFFFFFKAKLTVGPYILQEAIMGVNTRFKDSVFSFLFSNPEALRELYCAIEGIPLNPDAVIQINTLTDVLYMEQYNDISFTVDDRLVVLIEHQSTVNANLPLRLLLYVARLYEKLIERKAMYREKLVKIPRPRFICLYNGTAPYPARVVLRLSDAFEEFSGIGSPALDLEVQVLNINLGCNPELEKRSRTLGDYAVFVDKVREKRKELPLENAMKETINYCIGHGILRQFLETHGSEVSNMLLSEWNIDEAKEVWQEEAREEAWEKAEETKAAEIAMNLLGMGLSVEQTARGTGLTMEAVQKLAQETKGH
jgi:predicted transposase YdaD